MSLFRRVLTSEESERPALAVEVRIRWGADVVRVVHLDPPRSFFIGDTGSDFAVDGEASFGARTPLVLADGTGASALVPRGAEGTVHESAPPRQRTLEQDAGEPDDRRVRLELGTTVTIVLPGGTRGAAYRASPGDAAAAAAPVSFEIALVRAGRVVGRAWSLRGAARPLASFALAACAVLGVLRLAASQPNDDIETNDGVTMDQAYTIQQGLQAVAEREIDEREAREASEPYRFQGEEDPMMRYGPDLGIHIRSPWIRDQDTVDDEIRERPFDDPIMFQMGWRLLCAAIDPKQAGLVFASNRAALCASPVVTPLGLRFQGAPEVRDLLGRDTTDRWLLAYPMVLDQLGRHEIPEAVVHVAPAREYQPPVLGPEQRLLRAAVERAVRQRSREILACYELGREDRPDEMGDVLMVVSNVRGVVRAQSGFGERPPPDHVSLCVERALDRMTIPSLVQTGAWGFDVGIRRRAGRPSP